MAHGFTYEVPGTVEIYEDVKALIGDEQPKGLISHVVTKTPTGLRHTEVWETEADWQRFVDERLQPALGEVLGKLGITPEPPAYEALDVVDAWVGA